MVDRAQPAPVPEERSLPPAPAPQPGRAAAGALAWVSAISSALAALGTIGLFFLAFFTLEPAIENLQLRQENRNLFDANKDLVDKLKSEEFALRERESERRLLEQQIGFFRTTQDELKKEITAHREMVQALIQEAGSRRAEQQTLTSQVLRLGEERLTLTTSNRELAVERDRLQREIAVAKRETADVKSELSKVQKQRDLAWQINRRYILEQISKRAKEYFKTGWWRYDDTGKARTLFGYMLLKDYIAELQFQSGRDFIFAQFDTDIFTLLEEGPRRDLQEAVRSFVKNRESVFVTELVTNVDIMRRYFETVAVLTRTVGSTGFSADVKEPEIVTALELKKRERAFKEADEAVRMERTRVDEALATFEGAIDQMVEALAPRETLQ